MNITDNNANGNGKVHGQERTEDLEIGKIVDSTEKEIATRRNFKSRRPVRTIVRRVAVMLVILSTLVPIAALIWYYMGWMALLQLVLVVLVAYIVAAKKYRWFYVALMTTPRDLTALYSYIRLLIQIREYEKKDITVADIFRRNFVKHPNKVAIIFEDQEWTFTQIEEYSNKIANVFKSHGYKKGDVVALFLDNKPEFVCIWLGLSKLGVIVPLINTNQRLAPLVHSITIAKSQAVIFGTEFSEDIREILDKIESKVALYEVSGSTNKNIGKTGDLRFHNLNSLLSEASSSPPTITDKLGYHDRLVYIYTSGTTGLPKAAVITSSRYVFIAGGIHWMARFTPKDRFYVPLPLYHTAGGCMSMGQMIIFGSTVVLRKKFSASAFFADCIKYECTVGQYIGEMCRYILAVPPKPSDTEHNVRLMVGNGLRPQIWAEFVERYNIPKVVEFYGATEGNANIVNVDNTAGAIGFISRIIPTVYPIAIIKVDEASGEPIRDAHGLCIQCKPNEPGVFIGKILPNNPSRAFLGYVDEQASKKKIVYDVLKKGDSAFLSGDLIIADEFGSLFFKDRTGDTFRWKGENVSTSEVEAVLSNLVSYKDVVVYGVEIRGQEGRAGMAAILDPEGAIDFKDLAEGVRKVLPSYARPVFIRILKTVDMTGTYKLKKIDLQKDGCNPAAIKDNIYFLDGTGQYVLLSKESYIKIMDGTIRL